MADKKTTRYMELQMAELKADLEEKANPAPKKESNIKNPKHAEIAELYEEAAECEKDIEDFEEELKVVNDNELENIVAALNKERPNEERNYSQELTNVLLASWTQFVEVEKTHPKEQLELIQETKFSDIVEKFNAQYPDYQGNFKSDVKDILIKRWEVLIAIKKEHLKEEISDIKISGLKPTYAKRIYKQYHGID